MHFMFVGAVGNAIFKIPFFNHFLLICRNAVDFCISNLWPVMLLYFMNFSSSFVESLGFSI